MPNEFRDDDEFFRWYGDWAALTPATVGEVMDGFDRPWWVVGGWSVEVATGVAREHDDLDVSPFTPDRDGLWTNKRWPEHAAPLDEVTWVAADGVRYLRPEITLLMKARLDRPKDVADLDAALPVLDDAQRAWLWSALEQVHPDHRWLRRR